MNKCEQIHETIVRDIVDLISSVKDFDEVEWLEKNNNATTGSIAKRASNLILVFPVIVSNNLNIGTAMMISKAIERKCCALLQILFSAMQVTDAEDLTEYISKFHTNLKLRSSMDIDEFIDVMDKNTNESSVHVDIDKYNAVKEDMRNLNFYINDLYRETSINDYVVRKNVYGESTIMLEAKGKRHNNKNTFNVSNSTIHIGQNDVPGLPAGSNGGSGGGSGNNNGSGNSGRRSYSSAPNLRDVTPNLKDQVDYFKNQMSLSDIRKANELMPTNMIVNFISKDGSNVIRNTGISLIALLI